jgi:hypothetical protein
MGLKGLNQFQNFDMKAFLVGKRLAYLKASVWRDGDAELGSKVVTQIIEDSTRYTQPSVDNFGEQLTIKVRGVTPPSFGQLRPLSTEVVVTEIERAVIYGDYRNQLSIIGKIAVKDTAAK